MHPSVKYLNEPYASWAAIEPSLDFIGLYTRRPHHLFRDGVDCTPRLRMRFGATFLAAAAPDKLLVEKSPPNTLRIGFLNELAPASRFVHIVRNGDDVARSIVRVASHGRKIARAGVVNDWWGVKDEKWSTLATEGAARGFHSGEVSDLHTDAGRAVYEWLVSLHEVERWKPKLDDRLLEVAYEELTSEPKAVLQQVADFLDIQSPSWVERASLTVRPAPVTPSVPTQADLPPGIYADFISTQSRLGYGRNTSAGPGTGPTQGATIPHRESEG